MADTGYNPVPTVRPDSAPADNYQRSSPVAAAAMAEAGQSVVRLGTVMGQKAEVFDQVAADDAFNKFSADVSHIMRGNPNAQGGVGPDGQPIIDTGYMGLNGRAALDAAPDITKKINELRNKYSGGLKTPEQQRRFGIAADRFTIANDADITSHADAQEKAWFKSVNDTTALNSLNRISSAPDDPNVILGAAADLTNAYRKQEELNGAIPGDAVWNAAGDRAKHDIVLAQAEAIGVNEPDRALRIIEKNRDILGQDYDEAYNALRVRANEKAGDDAAAAAFAGANQNSDAARTAAITNPAQPIYQDTVTANPGGFSAGGLARLVQVESGGDPNARNGKHVGLGQFSPTTAAEVGLTDRNNPEESIRAAQRYAVKNAKYLTPYLGRAPTDAELYLAHQQGPGGARKLLTMPNALAADLVGLAAVRGNVPKSMRGEAGTMTAAEFVAVWAHKFNKTTPANANYAEAPEVGAEPDPAGVGVVAPPGDSAAPAADAIATAQAAAPVTEVETLEGVEVPRLSDDIDYGKSAHAEAIQAVIDNPDLSPDARQHAIARVNQMFAAQKIAQDETAAAKKAAEDEAQNRYVTAILNGETQGLSAQIANDPILSAESKMSLTNALSSRADSTVSGAIATYGSAYYQTLQQVLAEPGDPSRISSNADIIRMAADPRSGLTMAGAQKLIQLKAQADKSPDAAAAANAKAGLLTYAKGKLSFEQIVGNYKIPDPQGEAIFNARFVPMFEAAYAKAIADGGDPFQFLTQDNIDKMISGLRDPREMAMAKLLAQTTGMDVSQLPDIPVPEGVQDADAFKLLVTVPTKMADGTPRAPEKWMAAINALLADPSDSKRQQFDAHFARDNVTSQDIFDLLGFDPATAPKLPTIPVDAVPAAPAAPAVEAMPPTPVPETPEGKAGAYRDALIQAGESDEAATEKADVLEDALVTLAPPDYSQRGAGVVVEEPLITPDMWQSLLDSINATLFPPRRTEMDRGTAIYKAGEEAKVDKQVEAYRQALVTRGMDEAESKRRAEIFREALIGKQ